MDQLKDKVIIITGSASGIGLATAHLALGQGAKVLGVDIATCPLALEKDPNFAFIQCNLTSESAPAEVVKKCLESFGERIDVLINVAGVLDQSGSVDTVTDAVWDRCLAVNLTAPVKLMREVIPIMKSQKGGSIVNMASKAGLSGAVAGVAYTASKHGLIGVTKNVAWRFKADNIRCNAVCPGGVTSGITNSIDRSHIDLEALETMIPVINSVKVKRPDFTLIRAEDVAQAIIFLASGHSPRISGAVLPVDDAWSTL